MKPRFKRLQTRGWHPYLVEQIYGRTVSGHRYTRRPVEPAPVAYPEIASLVAKPHIKKRARDILILRKSWHRTLFTIAADERASSRFSSDIQFAMYMRRLATCMPAGVVFDTSVKWVTCGKYIICPFCRYRKALEALDFLEPYRRHARGIAHVSYIHRIPPGEGPLPFWELLKSRFRKRRGKFLATYVLHAPVYFEEDWSWLLKTTLIVLADRRTRLFAPASIIPVDDPRSAEFNSFRDWVFQTRSPPTKRGMVDAVCAGLQYAPQILDFGRTFAASDFFPLAQLTSRCRCGGTHLQEQVTKGGADESR